MTALRLDDPTRNEGTGDRHGPGHHLRDGIKVERDRIGVGVVLPYPVACHPPAKRDERHAQEQP